MNWATYIFTNVLKLCHFKNLSEKNVFWMLFIEKGIGLQRMDSLKPIWWADGCVHSRCQVNFLWPWEGPVLSCCQGWPDCRFITGAWRWLCQIGVILTSEERLIAVAWGICVCLFLIDSAGNYCCVWWGEHSITTPRLTAQASHGELGLQHRCVSGCHCVKHV